MKKGLFRILSLLVVFAMMFTLLTSCKKDETTEQGSSNKPASSSQIGDTAEPSEEESNPDEIIGVEVESGINVSRPTFTDGAISIGILEFNGDDILEEDPDFPDDDDIYGDIGDIDDGTAEEEEFIPFVQKYGKKASGKTRNITVDNSDVLFEGFYGLGANCFPTQFTLEAQKTKKDIPAFAEINAKRYNEMTGAYMRSWFQIDWIVTNECEEQGLDPRKIKNWEDNPDYVNYMNNVYDFDNDAFNSAVEYWRMLDEADTEVYLAYGWKIATRIQSWFGMNPQNPQIAGPYDLKKYAEACVALFKHCRYEEKLSNFNTLSFYNEPDRADDYTYQGSWDYQVIGNKCVWWAKMVEECHKALKADPKTKDVQIMVADCSNDINVRTENYVNVYLRNHATDYFDDYTFHCYPGRYYTLGNGNVYDALYESLNKAYYYYNDKPRWITEYYTTQKDILPPTDPDADANYAWDGHYNGWNCSTGAYFVASAHNGFSGMFKWSWVGGYLLDPLLFDPADGETSNWIRAKDDSTINKVHFSFYEESMINNYIRDDSNVHHVEWTGEDIRTAAFTSKDGKDFSLFLEANEGSTEKDIKVKLKKSLGGKTLYVFRFDWNVEKNAQATLIPCSDTINNVGTAFTYHIDDQYAVYIFTTYKPMQSLEVYEPGTNNDRVHTTVGVGKSVSIEPRFVENVGISAPAVSSSTIKAEIKYYSEKVVIEKGVEKQIVRREKIEGADMGSVSVAADGTVTYTAPADAEAGDYIAVRISYKDDPDRFASTMIKVIGR